MNDDLDSRTRKLEGQIQDFRIVHLSGEVKGGFGPLKQSADLEQRIKNVEESFRTFRLTGGEGVKVSGGVKFGGYVIEAKPPTVDSGTATGGGIVLGCTDPLANNFDPSATTDDGSCTYSDGACCCPDDPSCFITSQASCEECCPVCTFQGSDTTCDPNPCGGACCNHSGCVDALNETDCIETYSGVYQGDGVVCDFDNPPNPCPTGACCRAPDPYCDCVMQNTLDDCTNISGTYVEGATCEEAACPSFCDITMYLYTHSTCDGSPECLDGESNPSECGPDCFTTSTIEFCTRQPTSISHYITIGSGCPGTGDVSFTDFIAEIRFNNPSGLLSGDPPDTWVFDYFIGCLGNATGTMTLGDSPTGTWDVTVVGDGTGGTIIGMTYFAELIVTGDCIFP